MLELQASAGLYTHLDGAHSRIPIGELKIGAIALEQKHVLTNDIINDPRISDKKWAVNEGMSSFAGYPLLVGTRTIGVMAMFSRKPLTTGTAVALESIADLIAQGIGRKHAEDKLRASERDLSLIIETIPGLVWCAAPDGRAQLLESADWTTPARAPSLAHGSAGQISSTRTMRSRRCAGVVACCRNVASRYRSQCRLRRSDGVYRWFHVLGQAARDADRQSGSLVRLTDRYR